MIGGRLFGWERTGVPMELLRLHGVSYLIPIAGWWKRRVEAFLVLDQDSAFAVSYTDAACFDCHSKRNIMRNINMEFCAVSRYPVLARRNTYVLCARPLNIYEYGRYDTIML